MTNLPIVCTLTPGCPRYAAGGIVGRGAATCQESRVCCLKAFASPFEPSAEAFAAVARRSDAERHCCRFVRFQITVEADGGPIALEMDGPTGTRAFSRPCWRRDPQRSALRDRCSSSRSLAASHSGPGLAAVPHHLFSCLAFPAWSASHSRSPELTAPLLEEHMRHTAGSTSRASLAWLWAVEGQTPTRADIVGAILAVGAARNRCLCGPCTIRLGWSGFSQNNRHASRAASLTGSGRSSCAGQKRGVARTFTGGLDRQPSPWAPLKSDCITILKPSGPY